MHRVLKAKATKPAAANANLQQRVFNTFVQTYNEVRPHEALNDETPASRWHPSTRLLPTRITPLYSVALTSELAPSPAQKL